MLTGSQALAMSRSRVWLRRGSEDDMPTSILARRVSDRHARQGVARHDSHCRSIAPETPSVRMIDMHGYRDSFTNLDDNCCYRSFGRPNILRSSVEHSSGS